MITSLTSEQKAAFPRYVAEWTAHGLCTQPADRSMAARAIAMMYSRAGLNVPKIIWADSPLSGALVVHVLKNNNSIGDNVKGGVWGNVGYNVRFNVRASVRTSAGVSVWNSVWSNIGAIVRANVRASVGNNVRDSVEDNVRASVKDNVWNSIWASVWGQHEAGWLAFYRYFRDECGLVNETKALSGLWLLCRSCGWIYPYKNVCIATERPAVCAVDDSGLLHGAAGPAISYPDGFSVHAWHGTRVPAHWIEDPQNVSATEILKTRNVEQRAAGVAIVGMEKMLEQLRHDIVDSDPDPARGDLIRVHLPELPEPGYYLRADCPRNGRIMEAVNATEMDELTVRGAQAWRLGIPASEFTYPQRRT